MTDTIRVVLADDHALIRDGLRAALAAAADIVLAGEATTGDEARELCLALRPHILLLDLHMPGPPSIDTVIYLKKHYPALKILILTAYNNEAYVQSLVQAGVAGYILKDEATETVVQAIYTAAQGKSWFSRPVLDKLAEATQKTFSLTRRERQVLALIARGWSNTRIAAELKLAEQTVRNYTGSIFTKLEVTSRSEATVWAKDNQIS